MFRLGQQIVIDVILFGCLNHLQKLFLIFTFDTDLGPGIHFPLGYRCGIKFLA